MQSLVLMSSFCPIVLTIMSSWWQYYNILYLKDMQLNYNPEACIKLIHQKFDNYALPSIMEYIKIPNLSRQFDPDWATNGLLQKAAEHIRSWVSGLSIKGLKTQIIKHQGFTPIIFTQIQGDLPYTVFYYGHFDKQPPFSGWSEGMGPTIPVIKNEKLYGRGGADDGYSTYSTMLSIWALQELGVKIPRCVMITEGDEESGNHIDHYLHALKDKIGSPEIIFCLDSGTIDYQSLTLTTSLRGLLCFKLSVKILQQGMHSGDASGVVPSTFRIARDLLERIENSKTGQMIEELQVNIPPDRYQQMYQLSKKKQKQFQSKYILTNGAKHVNSNPLKNIIGRTWRPQLQIVGADGLPQTQNAGSVLRPKTTLKLSIRLPPTLDPQWAANQVKRILTSDIPYNANVQITGIDYCSGWNAPSFSVNLNKAIKTASEIVFKSDPIKQGEGGSIPLMNELHSLFPNAQFLITGVLGPQSNAHGPNEFLHLPYCKQLTSAMSIILQHLSTHSFSGVV